MIAPTITYAQTSPSPVPFSDSTTDPAARQYGPQATTGGSNNFTAAINNTAAEGIQNMRQLMLSLGSEIQRENLTGTFNDVVMAFAQIQANLTALQNQTNNITAEAAAAVASAQRAAEDARADAITETPAEDEVEVEEEEEPTEPEPTSTAAATTTTEDESEAEETDTSVEEEGEDSDGPRLDPEGDGGFPGDIDG